MDTKDVKDTLISLYEITLNQNRGINRDMTYGKAAFAFLFTAAGLILEKELSYNYFPALLGIGSYLAMSVVAGHFWRMSYYYESQIIRFEINRLLENKEPVSESWASDLSKTFQRGIEKNDVTVAILGLGYLVIGSMATALFELNKLPDNMLGVTLAIQLTILILPMILWSNQQSNNQLDEFNKLFKENYKDNQKP
ncbi:MAG: hypothetical protein NWE89_04285 [Candidatus Bathyarchaeota archaeon]|nr:hypothetical protein [Candidatus Bathyarchaeota archaeon]